MKKTAAKPTTAAPADVPIRRIDVADGRAPIGDVDQLVASIREVGRLLQPIVVNKLGRGRYQLVAGMTRLAAARQLGWKTVPATVVELDADAAELAELDENLARAELSAAQRARLTWRRQQAYERLYPQTTAKVAGGLARQRAAGNGVTGGAADPASETVSLAGATVTRHSAPPPRGFAADTAARVGRTARTVQQDAQVGRVLGEAVLARVERTPLANAKRELLALARLDEKRRSKVLREIEHNGHAKVSHAEAALAKARRQRELRCRAKQAEHQGTAGRPKSWHVIGGDCLDVLARAGQGGNGVTKLPDGLKPGGVRMVFADPPYDLGKDYGRGRADDRKGAAGYAEFTRRWVDLCTPLLTGDGSLWALIDHRCLRPVLNAVADAGLHQRGVVFWPDPFAQYQPRNFTPGRFFVYATKHPKHFVFHADAVAVPSKRQTTYADARAHPAGRTPSGCWDDISTLCGTFPERGEGMTQLPVPLVERPLLACTDAGDLILDPFGGEGTTAVAAVRHDRRCVLVERDRKRARRATLRLEALRMEA